MHVNHGLLRKGEPEQVIEVFRNRMDANLVYVDAVDRFLDKLAGVDDPEKKRMIIGNEFIEVFAEEARKLDGIEFLAQGTIWPDILESDAILREEFAKNGLEGKVWQYFTVVPDFKSTGIKEGKRAFEWCFIVRAINTTDVMTCTVENIPFELMCHITDRITHEVPGINRVLYDFTPKPTGTVEFE